MSGDSKTLKSALSRENFEYFDDAAEEMDDNKLYYSPGEEGYKDPATTSTTAIPVLMTADTYARKKKYTDLFPTDDDNEAIILNVPEKFKDDFREMLQEPYRVQGRITAKKAAQIGEFRQKSSSKIMNPKALDSSNFENEEEEKLATKSKRRARKNLQKDRIESYKVKSGLLSDEELKYVAEIHKASWAKESWLNKKDSNGKHVNKDFKTIRDEVINGDYKNFELLDKVSRNELASHFMKEHFVKPLIGQTAKEYLELMTLGKENVTEMLLNPLFRLGLSLASKSPDGYAGEAASFFQQLDEACSTGVMVQTLTSGLLNDTEASSLAFELNTEKEDIKKQCAEDSVRKIYLAKTLLLTQMGDFKKTNADGTTVPWDKDVSVAFSHCSRVTYELPSLEGQDVASTMKQDLMLDAYRNIQGKTSMKLGLVSNMQPIEFSPIQSRSCSTHDIKQRKVNDPSSATKEKKVTFNLSNQEGANFAIGGIFQKGVSGQMLKANGSCGHLYSMTKKAEGNLHGAMLIGLESDTPGMVNQMGHRHGLGNGEYTSSLGGQRTDEVGKKYGGRLVDLSQLKADKMAQDFAQLEHFMSEQIFKIRNSVDAGAVKASKLVLEKAMEKLAGSHMNKAQYDDFMRSIGSRQA